MASGGAPLSQAEWAAKVREWFPELSDRRARSSAFGEIARHHDYVAEHLGTTQARRLHIAASPTECRTTPPDLNAQLPWPA